MKQNTDSLIQRVRDKLFEQQKTVISDSMILDNINEGYRILFNFYAKDNPNYSGITKTIEIVPGVTEYDLPKDLYNKRIVSVNALVSNFLHPRVKLDYVAYEDSYLFDYPTLSALYPGAYSTLGNKLYLFPTARNVMSLELIAVPDVIPLGPMLGEVIRVNGNRLTLNKVSDASVALEDFENFVSVSDFYNGSHKQLYTVEAIEGTDLVLGSNLIRDTYKGSAITNIHNSEGSYCQWNPLSGRLTIYGVTGFAVGEKIEIGLGIDLHTEYLSAEYPDLDSDLATNITGNNGYSPGDILFDTSPFSETIYTVKSVGDGYIEVTDMGFKPVVKSGYVFSSDTIPSLANQAISALPLTTISVVAAYAGSLTAGNTYTVLLTDTTLTLADFTVTCTWNGVAFEPQYVVPSTATNNYTTMTYTDDAATPQTVNISNFVDLPTTFQSYYCPSHTLGNAGETVRMTFYNVYETSGSPSINYVLATIESASRVTLAKPIPTTHLQAKPTLYQAGFTGIPQVLDYSISMELKSLCTIHSNTPALYASNVESGVDGYESTRIIGVDDLVTLGRSTGKSTFGDNFEDFLVNFATLNIRASLNEDDPQIKKAIDMSIQTIRNDIGTRDLGMRIISDTPKMRSIVSGRRSRR